MIQNLFCSVPGDGGSQIEARVNRSIPIHFWCYDHTDWFDLWLNIGKIIINMHYLCHFVLINTKYHSFTFIIAIPFLKAQLCYN